ncbi:MAG: ATP-binding cassette domain-containing protein [Candidatus Latescibacteria bacterium]|nr:ATP-binding cassette domain-containing protein [bacterium]MBD3424346.1 ATP-binding cassette domain-containing protein [Candidatus Latescibacterota bacterium]
MTDSGNGNNSPVIALRGIARDFYDGKQRRRVLSDIDTAFYRGEFTIISGPSGSGKTTLLTIMALILRPTEGTVILLGNEITDASENVLATYRYKHYGFVFQNAALIPALTVNENILLASAVQGARIPRALRMKATGIIEKLGLSEFANTRAERLSGGQKQRVAIGRALINDPVMVLCDEPTSALDVKSSELVLQTLKDLAREDRAIVLVTHDPRVFPYADRLIQIEDGRIRTDTGVSQKSNL